MTATAKLQATATAGKQVYAFGGGGADGDARMKNLLGGKGANLAEMSSLGLPVPPGFTITTEVCTAFYQNDERYPDGLDAEVEAALAALEQKVGKTFGDPKNPLLVSVRSGARASMPGMMDTVLNLGLNDKTAEGLAALSGDRRFAFDSYRRFIQMYSNVVLGVDHDAFEEILEEHKEVNDYQQDTDLSADDWAAVIVRYKKAVQSASGAPFPDDPKQQLWGAIGAVFRSWMNDRAITYRRLQDIPASWGTAVNVQAMVFGNMGETSATGVAFTRNPSTGERAYYGEYLINAQGEDVVAGIRTPQTLTKAARLAMAETLPSMEEALPNVFAELTAVFERLERHYRDMQDIEFTVERGRLYVLQTRNGKRTAKSALKIAVDLAAEGLITQEEAIGRIQPEQLDQLLHPQLDPDAPKKALTTGLPASPGAATGEVVLDSDKAERLAKEKRKVILVRTETSPEDIHGMNAARAIVTARGGMTSHAAVVARGMGRPCVCGVSEFRIDEKNRRIECGGKIIQEGDVITVDGATGQIFLGEVPTTQPEVTGDFATLMAWADKVRRLKVRTNADTPADVEIALQFGAEGVGLCRTEHMFFNPERIAVVREMILAEDVAGRRKALDRLLPFQRADFSKIFQIMDGKPVTIRLLDPPLHEFLPHTEEDVAEVAKATGVSPDDLMKRARQLHESNPMLGHRGCRLGITYPEIYEMQARAIFEAQAEASRETGRPTPVEIMIPLVAKPEELRILKAVIAGAADEAEDREGKRPQYMVGTMIELPRAAIRADAIAEEAEFFSFGTNDLTQTSFGISRDDSVNFLHSYIEQGIFEKDPFVTIDREGVGELVRLGVARGRSTRGDLKLGVCGEHGGDPASIHFFESVGLDYVSCSPYRVPIARLAAAQAAIAGRKSG